MRAARIFLARLAAAVPTLVLVALGVFVLIEAAPGDAADAYLAQTGGDADFAAALRQRFSLGGGVAERLTRFAGHLATGDFGISLVFNRPVAEVITERLPVTLLLMAGAIALASGVGGALGLYAGARPGGLRDRAVSAGALTLLAMPSFWLALILVLTFSVRLQWLPVSGLRNIGVPTGAGAAALDMAAHLILPVLALGAGYIALYMRTLRAGMVEQWRSPHVRAAQARGLPQASIVWRQVARPALLPVVVLLGQQAGTLFGGSVVIETVFGIPGMGRLAYEAVAGRDTLLVAGVVLGGACVVILVNLVADLTLTRLDPRIGVADA